MYFFFTHRSEGNALDAAAQGAAQGFVLIGNIIANLIAVISFVAFLNAVLSWLGTLVGQEQLTFEVLQFFCNIGFF